MERGGILSECELALGCEVLRFVKFDDESRFRQKIVAGGKYCAPDELRKPTLALQGSENLLQAARVARRAEGIRSGADVKLLLALDHTVESLKKGKDSGL